MGKVKAGGEGGEAENGKGKREIGWEEGEGEGERGGGKCKQIYVTPLTLQSLYAAR